MTSARDRAGAGGDVRRDRGVRRQRGVGNGPLPRGHERQLAGPQAQPGVGESPSSGGPVRIFTDASSSGSASSRVAASSFLFGWRA